MATFMAVLELVSQNKLDTKFEGVIGVFQLWYWSDWKLRQSQMLPSIINHLKHKRFDPLFTFMLLIWGISICLYYGRIGFMPLDQSIVFDGGWRILSGQVPFRDFIAPDGMVPILIQGAFFWLFGVNWFAYCLQAAIFNGLFCILVYCFLRLLKGSMAISFFYAFLSGIIFYPPFGVPYMDQHAFFFVLLAFIITILASKSQVFSAKVASWILLPPIISIAFLCKQIPTVIAIPVLFIILLATTDKIYLIKMLISTLSSIIGIIFIFFAVLNIFKIDMHQLKLSIFGMAPKTGFDRIHDFVLYAPLTIRLKSIIYPFSRKMSIKLYVYDLIYLLIFAILAMCVLAYLLHKPIKNHSIYFNIVLSLALLIICNLFVLITLNEGENGIPYILPAWVLSTSQFLAL